MTLLVAALLRETWAEYGRHHAQWLAAALAYFAAFAMAPLVIVFVEIAGIVVRGHAHVLNLIFRYIDRDAGSGAHALREIVASSLDRSHGGPLAQTVGWIVFVVAALGLFGAAQFALNAIWDVPPERMTLVVALRRRAWSFLVLLVIALLLLVSLGVNAGLTVVGASGVHLSMALRALAKAADFFASFVVLWAGFAAIFSFLPDARPPWRGVRVGAAVTALLFVIGQFFVGWYLGTTALNSTYGVFGSLVALMIWVNYSSQILLFGAEFTHVYATHLASSTR